MARAAVTMAQQVDEGRSPGIWLSAVISHLKHCNQLADPLDELRARFCTKCADLAAEQER
jgi:hypothetical protein